ncbi:hypothetical protein Hanom_Chr04g00316841 [Helianthus anomalus]
MGSASEDTCRLSSSSARPAWRPPPPPPEVSFRMAGQTRSMSLAEFAVHRGLYTEAEIATDLYTQGLIMVDKPTLLGFWVVIAEKNY